MRSDEVAAHRDMRTLRVLFVGDSITYGTSRVDQSQIFTEILHRDLPSILHRPVEVLNASASASTIDNELSYVRSRGTFSSDMVQLVLKSDDLTQSRSTMSEVGDDLPHEHPDAVIGELYSRYIKPRILHGSRHVDAGDSTCANTDKVIGSNLADLDSFQALVSRQWGRMAIVYLAFRHDIPIESARSSSSLREWLSTRSVPLLDFTSAEFPYSSAQITLDNGTHFNSKWNLIFAEAIEKLLPELN
jgi:hypothetical protein